MIPRIFRPFAAVLLLVNFSANAPWQAQLNPSEDFVTLDAIDSLYALEAFAPRSISSVNGFAARLRSWVIRQTKALRDRKMNARLAVFARQIQEPLSDLDRIVQTVPLPHDPNTPTPALAPVVERWMAILHEDTVLSKVKGDRVLEAVHAQTVSHLRNVSFSIRTELGNDDYPHDPVLRGSYPYRPTLLALGKVREFWEMLQAESVDIVASVPNAQRKQDLMQQQKDVLARLTSSPLESYRELRERLRMNGPNASFPEFRAMVEYLQLELTSDPDMLRLCRNSAALNRYRLQTLGRLQSLSQDTPYLDSIYAIERAVEFFDVVCRAQSPTLLPPIYHSAHYEYYFHSLMGQLPDHVTIPTLADLTLNDLLKVRGVPIGLLGVKTQNIRVDGFIQTPYELFIHDVNHARRMYQLAKELALKRGISEDAFHEQSDRFVQSVLVPLFDFVASDSPEVRAQKQVMAVVLFEFLHEQSFPADPDILREQALRPPSQRTPFERIENNDTVVYYTEHRPTCWAYAYRKLAHDYFDEPSHRDPTIVMPESRTREAIVQAGAALLAALGMEDIPIETLREYVGSDDFPNASFRAGLQKDIDARPNETLPLGYGEQKSLRPLLLMKAQFQRTIQQVTPWDYSSFRFLNRKRLEQDLLADDPLRGATKVGFFATSVHPFRQDDVQAVRQALRDEHLDEVVIVLSRQTHAREQPSVEDLALQAMMIEAVFNDDSRVSIAVSGGDQIDEIRRNIGRHFADPDLYAIESRPADASTPSAELLRILIADGERATWTRWVAPEAAALIERWALFRTRVTPEDRRNVYEEEFEFIDSHLDDGSIKQTGAWQDLRNAGPRSPKAKPAEGPGPLRAMRSVFSFPFPEVIAVIKRLFLSFPYDIFAAWLTPAGLDHFHSPIIEKFVQFQRAAVPALGQFKFRYPTAGSNEGIREAMTSLAKKGVKEIYVLEGEYEGYREVADSHGISVIEIPEGTDPKSLTPGWWFISNPSARDGNILPDEWIPAICDAGHRVFYDLAYLGLTDFHRFDLSHPNIAGVFVSFSKSFGIFSVRAGMTFSREPLEGLTGNVWFKNVIALLIMDAIMRELPDPMHLVRLYRPLQTNVVARLNRLYGLDLKASDVILLAYRKGVDGLTEAKTNLLERYKRGIYRRLTLTPYFMEAQNKLFLHVKARQQNPGGPVPVPVPDDRVDWSVPFPGYQPTPFTSAEVLANDRSKVPGGWADEADFEPIKERIQKRISFEGPLQIDPATGLLLNPMGRTGKAGRGPLGAYGPNFAVDPVITRIHPETGRLQAVLVRRKDNQEWSIPGSMVNSSKELMEFMRLGFARKALGVLNGVPEEFDAVLDALFTSGKAIFKGYMDDTKNTDHAWMESVAVHFHASDAVARRMILQPGTRFGVTAVQWFDVDDILSGKIHLYANHTELIRLATNISREHPVPSVSPAIKSAT